MSEAADNPRLSLPGPVGDYFVFTKLNKGGMADVYLALPLRDPDPTWIALKLLRPELDGKRRFTEMFVSEGQLGLLLQHPNIVRTTAVGHIDRLDGPLFFLAMEYIQGRDLGAVARTFRKDNARMPVGQAVHIIEQTLQGLAWAHALTDETGAPLHLVNRDISPANIMIGFDGAVQLIDFGIAQATLDYQSQIGAIKGKIRYMSPEQVRGLPVDARSDLFSLAVVFYQLLTGVDPFPGESDFERMERIRTAPLRPPSELNRHVRPALDAILQRALAKEPADRYPSADAFLADLRYARDAEAYPWSADDLRAFMERAFAPDRALVGAKLAEVAHLVQSSLPQLLPAWSPLTPPDQLPTPADLHRLFQLPLTRAWIAQASPALPTDPDPSAELSLSIDVEPLTPSPPPTSHPPAELSSAPKSPARWVLLALGLLILLLAAVLVFKLTRS